MKDEEFAIRIGREKGTVELWHVRQKDVAGAVLDQIKSLGTYPDDEALLQEVARRAGLELKGNPPV